MKGLRGGPLLLTLEALGIMDTTVSQIVKLPRVVETLASVFDVDFSHFPDERVWFIVRAGEQFLRSQVRVLEVCFCRAR